MINKLGLIIFILGSQHFTFFNVYSQQANDWKQLTYLILTIVGGIMYLWEKEEE